MCLFKHRVKLLIRQWPFESGFLDAQASPAPTADRKFVSHTFGFPFCQRLGDLTMRRDDIVVAVMVADMVVSIEVDKVADKVAVRAADKNE